ncbi:MAG: DUF423 domain-containing protein [Opitutae bacterium]|jgi:uncharacterized membrane protein YgdD (TMEM256/DUF423 family)|nr:DUF423 domain-containing protein [Opitutae bacterium]
MKFCTGSRVWLTLGALGGASSVLLGAYGAHGLEELFSEVPRKRTAYGNAVDYQMIHSLLLVVLGFFGSTNKLGARLLSINASLLVASMLLFSGSIYLWVFGGSDWLLKLTPAGGIGFVLSWLLLGFQVRAKNEK